MSADEEIKACPECDASGVYYRATAGDWYCKACATSFAQPVERAPICKAGRTGLNGLAGVLEETDPDAVGGAP